jgi:hypothetical protein
MADLDAQGGLPALMRMRPTTPDGQPALAEDDPRRARDSGDDPSPVTLSAGPEERSRSHGATLAADRGGRIGHCAQVGQHVVPAGQLEHWETSALPHAGRAQCGVCESIISSGSVVSTPPQWDFVLCGNVTHRTLYCPHCHHLQRWTEGCSTSGEPNGAVTEGPRYIRGDEVDDFLTQYPRAVGLLPA